MSVLFYKFKENIARCFRGYNLLWQVIAALLTAVLVMSGFDWFYFASLRNSVFYPYLFPAAIVGGILPIIIPLCTLVIGFLRKDRKAITIAGGVGQAAILGLLVSSTYKFFTGRMQPPHAFLSGMSDISKEFRFGFFRGGVFWGWPSSHTTVAFAVALALARLYPENKLIKILAFAFAIYVGIGVSVSIHWFSDFAAGVIIGSVIGVVVGNSFHRLIMEKLSSPALL